MMKLPTFYPLNSIDDVVDPAFIWISKPSSQ